jgi:hypothetical protein
MKTIFMLFISAVFVVYSIYQFMNRLEAKKNIVKQLLFIVLGMTLILMTLIDIDKKEKQEEHDRELMARIEYIAKKLKISNDGAKLVYEDINKPETVALANNIDRQIYLFYEKKLENKNVYSKDTVFDGDDVSLREDIHHFNKSNYYGYQIQSPKEISLYYNNIIKLDKDSWKYCPNKINVKLDNDKNVIVTNNEAIIENGECRIQADKEELVYTTKTTENITAVFYKIVENKNRSVF